MTHQLIITFAALIFFVSLGESSTLNWQQQIVSCLEKKECQVLEQKHNSTPSFFANGVVKALLLDGEGKYQQVIDLLSQSLTQTHYASEWEHQAQDAQAIVGVPLGFSFWRELSYLLLGRAYYAQKQFRFAEERYNGVPSTSAFYSMASIELFWTYIAQQKTDQALSIANKIDSDLFRSIYPDEALMMSSLVNLLQKKANMEREKALKAILSVAYNDKALPRNRMLAFNLYATFGFDYWHQQYNSLSEDRREFLLKDIIAAASQIPSSACNEECQFFTAEAWWNLATLYRLKDPINNQSSINSALKKADAALADSMSRAVKNKKTDLREDAYFLGVVITWERSAYDQALLRSQVYDQLFPVGRYREDVYQLMADYYFERKEYENALKIYQLLVKVGDLEKSTYGMFKAAWSFYNLGQKWSALRHLERILLVSKDKSSDDSYHVGVLSESRRDMLLFLAELTEFNQALDEIGYLESNELERSKMIEQLADTYKKLGRFDQSSLAYKYLLDKSNSKTQLAAYLNWLKELLDNHLRERRFDVLLADYQSYEMKLAQLFSTESFQGDNSYHLYLQSMDLLTITLHRESKRVSDLVLTGTVDSLYASLWQKKHFDFSFAFYYYGAQRLEEKTDLLQSADWYRKASTITGDNQYDAALSALRVCRQFIDGSSSPDTIAPEIAIKIKEVAIWFRTHYTAKIERHIADSMYFETLFLLKDDLLIHSDYSLLLRQDGLSDESYRKFSQIINSFYRAEKWSNAFFAAKISFESCGKCRYRQEILRLMQESSFQSAFTDKNPVTSIPWYQTAIDIDFNSDVTLKAWYNLMVQIVAEGNKKVVDSRWNTFEEYLTRRKKKTDSPLIFDTRMLVAKFYYQQKLVISALKAELLAKTENSTLSADELLLVVQDYIRVNGMEAKSYFTGLSPDLVKSWQKSNPELLQRLRLYYQLDDYHHFSTNLLQTLMPLSLVNFYDALFNTNIEKHVTINIWQSDLFKKSSAVLQEDRFLSFALNTIPYTLDLKSVDLKDFDEINDAKKAIIEQQFVDLLALNDQRANNFATSFIPYAKSPFRHIRWRAACDAEIYYGDTQRLWSKFSAYRQKFYPDWKEMDILIEQRLASNKKLFDSYSYSCHEAKNQSVLYIWQNSIKKNLDPFPERNQMRFLAHDSLDELELANVINKSPELFDQVYELLQLNLPMVAEWLVDHHQDQDQRTLSMALLRYYFNDASSVNSLLQSIPASSTYSSDVVIIQGLLRLQSGSKPPYYQLKAKAPAIRSRVLKDLQRKLDE